MLKVSGPTVLTLKKAVSVTTSQTVEQTGRNGFNYCPDLFRGFAVTRTVLGPIISGLSNFETALLGSGSKMDSFGVPYEGAHRRVFYPSEVNDFSTARRIYF